MKLSDHVRVWRSGAAASWHLKRGRWAQAESALCQAVGVLRESGTPAALAARLTSLGQLYARTGRAEKAKESFREALSMTEGAGHASGQTIRCGVALANLLVHDHPAEAREVFERCLMVTEGQGARSATRRSIERDYLMCLAGLEPQTELNLGETIASWKRELGQSHRDVGALLFIQGYQALLSPDHAKAAQALREAAAIQRLEATPAKVSESPWRFELAWTLHLLGRALKHIEEFASAEAALVEARGLRLSSYGSRHFNTANTNRELGELYLETGRPELATPYLLDAWQVFRDRQDERWLAATARWKLGTSLRKRRAYAQASVHLAGVVADTRTDNPLSRADEAAVRSELAEACLRAKDLSPIAGSLEAFVDVRRDALGAASSAWFGESLEWALLLLRRAGHRPLAERLCAESIAHPTTGVDVSADCWGVLDDLIEKLSSLSNHVLAERLACRALRLCVGDANADAAHRLRAALGSALVAQGRWDEAQSVLEATLEPPDADATGSETEIDTDIDTESRLALAQCHLVRGNRASATAVLAPVFERPAESRRAITNRVRSLVLSAFVRAMSGDLAQANQLAVEAYRLGCREDVPPLVLADALDLIGLGDLVAVNLRGAQALFRRAHRLREETLGPTDPSVLWHGLMLGMADLEAGESTSAARLLKQAVAVARATYGEKSPPCAVAMTIYGRALSRCGHLAAGERLCRHAVGLMEQEASLAAPYYIEVAGVLPGTLMYCVDMFSGRRKFLHPVENENAAPANGRARSAELGFVRYQLGVLLCEQNKLRPAIEQLKMATALLGEELHVDDVSRADALLWLARCYMAMDRADLAEPAASESRDIVERALSTRHVSAAMPLRLLAVIQMTHRDDVDSAVQLARQALDISRVHGDRIGVVEAMALLGTCEWSRGAFSTALKWLLPIAEMARDGKGEPTAMAALMCALAAHALARTGRRIDAMEWFAVAHRLEDAVGAKPLVGSEGDRLRAVLKGASVLDLFSTVVCSSAAPTEGEMWSLFRRVLRLKGAEFAHSRLEREAELQQTNTQLRQTLVALRDVRARLKQLAVVDLSATVDERALVEELGGLMLEREALEAYASRYVAPDADTPRPTPALECVDVLPSDAALLECFATEVVDPTTASLSPRYYVLVITNSASRKIRLVDLGPCGEVDEIIRACRESQSMGREEPPLLAQGQVLSPLLHALESLEGCERLFVAPDGCLAIFPFELLRLRDGRRLSDVYEIGYVWSGESLFSPQAKEVTARRPADPIVIASPAFASMDGDAGPLRPLPGAALEGERVSALLGVPCLSGADARRDRVASARGPSVLHIATHGDYIRTSAMKNYRITRLQNLGWNPMAGALLVFAGFGDALRGVDPSQRLEDTLLLAEEVAALDLAGTELVVLSACSTGEGAIVRGHGVRGLRKAFSVAGAGAVVTTLWPVEDFGSAVFMVAFYRRLLEGKRKSEALREAQGYMRNLTTADLRSEGWLSPEVTDRFHRASPFDRGDLAIRRLEAHPSPERDKPFSAPRFWAAFVLYGDSRPLSGNAHRMHSIDGDVSADAHASDPTTEFRRNPL